MGVSSVGSESVGYPLGRRIAVFGKGGKTTLARALARRFGLEFVELDAIRHMAGWEERPDDDFRAVVTNTLDQAETGWVTDANYRVVRDLIFDRVDTAIVLALPWRVMFWRTLKRSVRRAFKREELWNGNRESWRLTFFSKYSVVYDLWIRRRHFVDMAAEFSSQVPDAVTLRIVNSSRELEELYAELGLERE